MTSKFALVIANTEYQDARFAKLTAPGKDAEEFAQVLRDAELAAFQDVQVLLNERESKIRRSIAHFFADRKRDDLLLLYFSGHGIRNGQGQLFLAANDTEISILEATGIPADFITYAMNNSRSQRQLLILDCCNSGAFAHGSKSASAVGKSMGIATAFEGSGFGRVVLTATDATQFAWEGDKVIGDTQKSVFTHFLIEGLKGDADRDGDGRIHVDELYDYAYEQVVRRTPKQTPGKWSYKQQGDIVLRENLKPRDVKPAPLPSELFYYLEHPSSGVRSTGVQELIRLLDGKHLGLARAAQEKLREIAATDDSLTLRKTATDTLIAHGIILEQVIETPKESLSAVKPVPVEIPKKEDREEKKIEKPTPVPPLPTGESRAESVWRRYIPKRVKLNPRLIGVIASVIGVMISIFGLLNILLPTSLVQPIGALAIGLIGTAILVWMGRWTWGIALPTWLAVSLVLLILYLFVSRPAIVIGSVINKDGSPAVGLRLVLTDHNGVEHRVNTDEEGKFEVANVPEGRYSIETDDDLLISGEIPSGWERLFGSAVTIGRLQYKPTDALPPPTVTPTPESTDMPLPSTKTSLSPTPTLGIGSTTTSEKDSMTILYVPAGEFTMGAKVDDALAALAECKKFRMDCQLSWFMDEPPPHKVNLDAFWIDQTEVTNAMYANCVKVGACNPPSSKKSHAHYSYYDNPDYDNYPVIYVSWDAAVSYCTWAGRELPTEAQWEKAARGENANIYPWGNETPNTDLLNYNSNIGETTEVDKYPDGKSRYSALNMAGNVWEWVNDWYDVYPGGAPNASSDFGQKYRVLRGGSWDSLAFDVPSAHRGRSDPSRSYPSVGFRCAISATP